MRISQITIIGTGLIGGSLGLALRKNGFRGKIVGCDRPKVLARAKRMGAIHDGVADTVQAVQGSDLVILSTPVIGIVELIGRLSPHLSPSALLTDVGSTKAAIVARAQYVFGDKAPLRFLPGHPMAGKKKPGGESAAPDFLRGTVLFLTPLPGHKITIGAIEETPPLFP